MTTRPHRPRRRRGIFLINILMAIGLLAAFVIVAERVFRLSLLTTAHVATAEDRAARLDRALPVLRADVWTATKVDPKDTHLLITDPDGHTIDWQTDPTTGDLLRTAGTDQRRWPELHLTFHHADHLLSVTDKSGELAVLRQAGGPL